jgi:type IV pilus assembly protein PilP
VDAEQRAQTKPEGQPIPEPKKFTPQAYTQETAFEPFSNQKLTQALKRETTQSTSSAALLAPELRAARSRSKLPAGRHVHGRQPGQAGPAGGAGAVDNLLYQVRPGNYLGQNYGKITKVGEADVVLREIVQDAAGEWIERTATLQLQERSK